jgi:hypothetical protein
MPALTQAGRLRLLRRQTKPVRAGAHGEGRWRNPPWPRAMGIDGEKAARHCRRAFFAERLRQKTRWRSLHTLAKARMPQGARKEALTGSSPSPKAPWVEDPKRRPAYPRQLRDPGCINRPNNFARSQQMRCRAKAKYRINLRTRISAEEAHQHFFGVRLPPPAEGVGFEPTEDSRPRRFSRPVPSTARPAFLCSQFSPAARSAAAQCGRALEGARCSTCRRLKPCPATASSSPRAAAPRP